MQYSLQWLFCQILLLQCRAQPGMDGLDRELVAQYKSNFSQGRIWRKDGDLSLELNGVVMSDTSDEHVYHEMLVHPGLLSTKTPHNVLIIGGAEGATAREVLRHSSVSNVTMVDIDEDLVKMCRDHLKAMHQGSFDSAKLKIHYDDGANFVGCLPNDALDVVIVDGIDVDDERGQAKYGDVLFSEDFYRNIHRILRPDGIMVQYMSDADCERNLRKVGFAGLSKYGVDIWSYPGYGARFIIASKRVSEPLNDHIKNELADPQMKFKYLTVSTMDEAFRNNARRMKGGGGAGGGAGGEWSNRIFMVLAPVLGIVLSRGPSIRSNTGCGALYCMKKRADQKKLAEEEEAKKQGTEGEEKALLQTITTQEHTRFEPEPQTEQLHEEGRKPQSGFSKFVNAFCTCGRGQRALPPYQAPY